jgi:hypothetical protein
MVIQYLDGWRAWVRAIYLARTKKRGAGPMSWPNALKMAAAYRFIVDGQERRRLPRYLKRIF